MLQHPISNAAKNAERVPEGRRHLEIIKKFATSLFIYTCRTISLPFLQQKVTMALPSLRSVQGYIYSEYNIINEGVFRFDELSNHIKRYNLSGLVTIGEDG